LTSLTSITANWYC